MYLNVYVHSPLKISLIFRNMFFRYNGLFISMLQDGTQIYILQGNLRAYKGAIIENLMAGIFSKMGRMLYYYHKDSGLEIGFVIRYKGGTALVEVKATSGNTKSTKNILAPPRKISHRRRYPAG